MHQKKEQHTAGCAMHCHCSTNGEWLHVHVHVRTLRGRETINAVTNERLDSTEYRWYRPISERHTRSLESKCKRDDRNCNYSSSESESTTTSPTSTSSMTASSPSFVRNAFGGYRIAWQQTNDQTETITNYPPSTQEGSRWTVGFRHHRLVADLESHSRPGSRHRSQQRLSNNAVRYSQGRVGQQAMQASERSDVDAADSL